MQYCYSDIIKVSVIKDYELHLQFEDGVTGSINIADLVPFRGIFEPLKDQTYFSKVYINHDLGTICWENGADISPATLYKYINTHSQTYEKQCQTRQK